MEVSSGVKLWARAGSSARGVFFNEASLRDSVDVAKWTKPRTVFKETTETHYTDLIYYKKSDWTFNLIHMNPPSKFCSSFTKMRNFGSELQMLCKQMRKFLKAAVRNTCISHSLDKHEQT